MLILLAYKPDQTWSPKIASTSEGVSTRKMGHITIICNKFEDAYAKAKFLKNIVKVKSK